MNNAAPTQRQIMMCFAYLAYCGENITSIQNPNPSATISGLITNGMTQLWPISAPNNTWSIVWGPAVYTVPGALYQDNLMYVVQNQQDSSQYAIAVRGTNFVSELDWLLEDFDVLQQMPWPPGSDTGNNGAMISESTSIDLQIVLAMQGSIAGGSTQTLMQFLQAQTKNGGITVGVTGHSLGGCLSGTLALYLNDNQSAWDAGFGTATQSTLYCITFAAPSAGNAAFATYSNEQFQNQYKTNPAPNWLAGLTMNCDVVQCNLDAAPLFWVADNIYNGNNSSSALADIYAPPNCPDPPYTSTTEGNGLDFTYAGTFDPEVNANLSFLYREGWSNIILPDLFPLIAGKLAPLGYTQIGSSPQLQGTFYNAPPPPNTATGAWPAGFSFPVSGGSGGDNTLTVFLQAFVTEAGYQHSYSYPQLLGVPNLNEVVYQANNPNAGK